MQKVKKGDTIKIHYHGKLSDGTTFDSSEGRVPLEFEVGSGMVIKGFDEGVEDMAVGEKKSIFIPFAEAYGPVNEEMIIEFPKSQFPPDLTPTVGIQLEMSNTEGHRIPVTIVDVKEETVVLDANHALAGKDLHFDLELVEISSPSPLIVMP